MKSFEHDPSLWDDGHLNSGVLAKQGYAVLVQDTRGRFSSSGEFVPVQTCCWDQKLDIDKKGCLG